MKPTRIAFLGSSIAALALAALALPTTAQAGGHLSWSVGISSGFPAYQAPAPVYVQPRRVYVQPQPIYVQPRPIYVQPQPVYVQPRSVYLAPSPYFGAGVVAAPAPLLVAPRAVYPIGWAPRGHWRHRHGRDSDWRY